MIKSSNVIYRTEKDNLILYSENGLFIDTKNCKPIMDHLKEGLRNDIEKLTSSTHRILSDMEGISSIDIDILLESTRKFYERTIELREVFQEKKRILSDEPIVMPFISGEQYKSEPEVQNEIVEQPIMQGFTPPTVVESEIIEEKPVIEDIKVSEKVEEIEEHPISTQQEEKFIAEEEVVEEEYLKEETIEIEEELPTIEEEIVEIKEEVVVVEEATFEARQPAQEEIFQPEAMPVVEEKVIEEEKKPRPELFDYLNTSNIREKVANVMQPDLFATENTTSATTLGERFQQTPARSVLDQISSSANNEDISTRINQTAVEDIRQVIGINEKFLFINELFGGNMKEYNDFILALNDIRETDEAQQYMGDVRERKGWNIQSLAYVSFLKIFERKFVK